MNCSMNEAFLWLEEISSSVDVQLKYSDKDFFVTLCEYCEKYGDFDKELELPYVDLGVSKMRKLFGLPNHIIQNALSSLCACGVLERIVYAPCFRPLKNGKVITNKPSRIYLKCPYFNNQIRSV